MRLLLLCFSLFVLYNVSSEEYFCSKQCVCLKKAVRCLHQGLLTLPKVPRDSRILDVRFNKIYEIPPGSFSHLTHLRSLLLNDNHIMIVERGAFHGLNRLVYLYLYRNRIQSIDPEAFQGLDHLEQLYIHVNELHQIGPKTFSNLPHLERLYLHNNKLEHIPENSFSNLPRLQKLRLDSNALICDCSMVWLIRRLSNHKDMNVAATCYSPAHLTGSPLTAMKEDDLHCRQPEIMLEPKDVVVQFGDNAMFTCKVSGEPTPEIVWLYDSNYLPLDTNRYEVISNGTLMIHNAHENDTGFFECMAKNSLGEVRSRPAKIMVKRKIKFTDELAFLSTPKNIEVIAGKTVSLDCQAQGNPKPHMIWLYNGEKMLLNERISLKHNGTLAIENTVEEDAGEYICQAENINGKISSSAYITVLTPPSFTIHPIDQEAIIGDSVELLCKAHGVPVPTITWYKNQMLLPETDIIKVVDDKLLLSEVTSDDDGIYQCKAENSQGLIEATASLYVKEIGIIKPHVLIKPQDSEAYKETTIQLSCEFESEPPATIEWRKDGSRIGKDDRISVSRIGNLIINNLTVTDTGLYECSVYNDYGRETVSAFLTVKDHILPSDEYINIALTEATRDVDQAIERTVQEMFKNNTSKDFHDLFRISRYPNAPARDIARAAEIYERALSKVKDFVEIGLKSNSSEPFDYHNVLSPKHLEIISRLSGCTANREDRDCSNVCLHNKYRSIDGSCNNYAHPIWGSSLTGFRRILSPIYENGFSQPVGWNKNTKYNGFSLPNARLISTTIITTNEISEDVEITHMTMQWGQWLDHDLDHALPSVSSQTWDGVDCKKTCDYAAPCFPMDVPANDPRINNRRCIDFIRTSAVCGSGMTSVLFGKLQPREQINQLTSYLDASQVYGYEESVALDLRDLSNNNGLLRVGATFSGKKPLLPTTGINGMDCRRNLNESNRECFVAGDIRANEQIGLAAMHTIFLREHNRIALQLKVLNPFWDGDKVYQEARKIVGAEMQMITYEHWLPLILGPEGFKDLGKYKSYNKNINPSISNVFATAALRFGHSLINPVLNRYDENFDTIPQGHLLLRDAFFSPWRLVEEGGVDPLLRGMFVTPAKLKTPTQNLNSELTERLFYTAHAVALDLAAMNIQRARDHAIPPYTKWREYCNMSEVNDFDDLAGEIGNAEVRSKLKDLYGSPHNIDVWVGGILEDQVDGGKVGPLFRCLLLEQFKRLRDGDRLWYENPNTFKTEQLQEIKKTSLARILCDNGDNIDTINENVFLLPDLQDGLLACEDIQGIDLRSWADCEDCDDSNERVKREIHNPKDESGKRFNNLEQSHRKLEGIIQDLQNRIKNLETKCISN